MNEVKVFKVSAVALLAITTTWLSWYTVDQGERGVLLRNGAVIGVADAGLGFKIPFIDGVRRISIQNQAAQYEGVLTYSKDQQTAELKISVSYRLPADQVAAIYAEYGGQDGIVARLLDRQLPAATKAVFGRYNAVTAIQDRGRMAADMLEELQAAVKGPIIIDSLQIENIDFSDAYENSIEQRMLAEVEVQKVKQNAEREKVQAEIMVIQAQASADSSLAKARADAEATRLNGDAQADAIRARAKALADNPALIELVQAEKWNGILPTTMVPSGAVPFLNVGQ
jgi:regulator of protease activity HflC (stomatin/prohibitin superfamily)